MGQAHYGRDHGRLGPRAGGLSFGPKTFQSPIPHRPPIPRAHRGSTTKSAPSNGRVPRSARRMSKARGAAAQTPTMAARHAAVTHPPVRCTMVPATSPPRRSAATTSGSDVPKRAVTAPPVAAHARQARTARAAPMYSPTRTGSGSRSIGPRRSARRGRGIVGAGGRHGSGQRLNGCGPTPGERRVPGVRCLPVSHPSPDQESDSATKSDPH